MTKVNEIKKLREKTQMSMLLCAQSLKEANGCIDEAYKILMKKAAGKIKIRGGETEFGYVCCEQNEEGTALVALKTEDSFVAKNHIFIDCLKKLTLNSLQAQNTQTLIDNVPLEEFISANLNSLGVKVEIAKQLFMPRIEGTIISKYAHNVHNSEPNVAKEYVLVRVAKEIPTDIAYEVALHISVNNVKGISSIPTEEASLIKDIVNDKMQERMKNKPEEIVKKATEDAYTKALNEYVLYEQAFFMDETTTVGKALKKYTDNPNPVIEFYRIVTK